MPPLIVEALTSRLPEITAGTEFQVEVGVSVTDENGNPVNGLKADNFTIQEVAGSAPQVELKVFAEESSATGWPVDGFYSVSVGPMGDNPWHDASYVCALVVSSIYSKGTVGKWMPKIVRDRGQTLFTIDVRS
jgi:hypothetical protein